MLVSSGYIPHPAINVLSETLSANIKRSDVHVDCSTIKSNYSHISQSTKKKRNRDLLSSELYPKQDHIGSVKEETCPINVPSNLNTLESSFTFHNESETQFPFMTSTENYSTILSSVKSGPAIHGSLNDVTKLEGDEFFHDQLQSNSLHKLYFPTLNTCDEKPLVNGGLNMVMEMDVPS
jgi:hypothetical protein